MVWDKRRRGVESVSVRVAVGRRSYLELLLVPLDQLPHGLRHASVVGVRACRRGGRVRFGFKTFDILLKLSLNEIYID